MCVRLLSKCQILIRITVTDKHQQHNNYQHQLQQHNNSQHNQYSWRCVSVLQRVRPLDGGRHVSQAHLVDLRPPPVRVRQRALCARSVALRQRRRLRRQLGRSMCGQLWSRRNEVCVVREGRGMRDQLWSMRDEVCVANCSPRGTRYAWPTVVQEA